MKEKPSKFAEILRHRKDSPAPEAERPAKRGRPGGKAKRNNPEYVQVTAYIRKTIYEETKINLIRLNNREFSGLVEELLLDWNWKQSNRSQ